MERGPADYRYAKLKNREKNTLAILDQLKADIENN